MRRGGQLLAFILLALSAKAAAAGRVDYNSQVRPLLSDRCYTCHGPDDKARKKKLRLDTREGMFKELADGRAVVRAGDTNRSELVRRILTADDDDVMPPADSKLKLSAVERFAPKVGRRGSGFQSALVPDSGRRSLTTSAPRYEMGAQSD